MDAGTEIVPGMACGLPVVSTALVQKTHLVGYSYLILKQKRLPMPRKMLVVLTTTATYPNLNRTAGIWLGEAVHFVEKVE
ncbi:MAG: hypothetical protein NTNFB01_23560 [Nitrospira sp.]|jgi:hypothetical protein